MADLVAGDVTVTVVDRVIRNKERVSEVSIAFGNGALTYPANGVPMPTYPSFGLTRNLKDILLSDPANASGLLVKYDKSNNKIRLYRSAAYSPTFTGTAGTGSQIVTYSPGAGDILGSANTDAPNADQASKPTNADRVDTLHAVAAGAWTYSEDAEIDVPRNVAVCILNDSGGPLNLYEGVMTFAVTGTFRGAAQSENITLTSSAGNKSVANTKYRYVYGVKPFSTITSVVLDNKPDNDIKIGIGVGSKIGFLQDSYSGADADFYKLVKNGVDLALGSLADHTNKTINFDTLADGDEVSVSYKIKVADITPSGSIGSLSAGVFTEMTGAVAAMTLKGYAIGW